MLTKEEFRLKLEKNLLADSRTTFKTANTRQLHGAVARVILEDIMPEWQASEDRHSNRRRAYYLSAEFLMGRAVFNNLYCAGLLEEAKEIFAESGRDFNELEDIEDASLGNGGLGRLAACFLDSAAAHDLPLNGYGIRYRYGLFKQSINGGFQTEEADCWLNQDHDEWGIRCANHSVTVEFGDQAVRAVPYDTPIIGYDRKSINTLRLWQAEALPGMEFKFDAFDRQDYQKASEGRIMAEAITNVLYPNDNYEAGLRLRLKQQYFFCSASIQDILRQYKEKYGNDFSSFAKIYAVQLNDTHPTVSIPELIRLLMFREGLTFDDAFDIAQKTFSYTNHTIMAEALEKWSIPLFKSVLPIIYEIILLINDKLVRYLHGIGQNEDQIRQKVIVDGDRIHMARMAIYCGSYVNGVAAIHSDILKKDALKEWYELYPDRFQNKTNGITQRRWLGLCNPELTALIAEKLGNKDFLVDLSKLKGLVPLADDNNTLEQFRAVKRKRKEELCSYIKKMEGVTLDPSWLFDIQVKRLHEYKRQLLNAFGILDIYYQIKDKKLNDFAPTVFIFGAKAAPAYRRAKGIIKFINEIAKLVNNDPETRDKMKVLFIQNYNVSYAEKLIPAADFSEQISTAGTEASGTGNMKFMLNGAVTIGTWDGANIEISQEAGEYNEYIFGARVEEINQLKNNYHPKEDYYYKDERLKRVINTLVDGTFQDGETGMFGELYTSLTNGFSWHKPDNYFICRDFGSYCEARLRANRESRDVRNFSRKCWLNIANAGKFSSDRTIAEYANELWHI